MDSPGLILRSPPKAGVSKDGPPPSFETGAIARLRRALAGLWRPLQDEGGGRLRAWARAITRDVHALYLAGRDPRVPWYAKAAAAGVAAYALSPIDLIPDFIPVLGQLDDLLAQLHA